MSRIAIGMRTIWRWARAIVPLAVGMVGLVLVIAWLAGSFETKITPGREEPPTPTLAGQPTSEVHEVTKAYIEEAIGTLKAASRTVISAKVLATIVEITVVAGDQVAAGDVLVRLDDMQLRAQLNQAEQALVGARANETEAETNYNRMASLVERNAVAKSEADEARRRFAVARSEVFRQEQAVAEAKVLLSYTVIRAPKRGRIVDRLAEPGDTARPGEPLLVLYDAASLRLEAPVLEHLAVKMKTGDKLDVHVDALNRTIKATIDEIVPQADAPSRSFLVKASLPRSDDLYEGMAGRLLIPAGERRHLCLDMAALQKVGQLEMVDVVLPDGRLERRFVKTGRVGLPGNVEVLSGLKAGERVVLHDQVKPQPTVEENKDDGQPREQSADN